MAQERHDLFYQNMLVKRGFDIGGQRVDLIILLEPFGSKDKQELSFSGGHVGMFFSGKTQGSLAPRIAEWLNQRV